MEPDLTDPAELGRYAVTRPWWRWMPGMRVRAYGDWEYEGVEGTYLGLGAQFGDLRVQWDDYKPRGAGRSWSTPQNFRPATHIGTEALPAFTGPTLGALLALAEELAGRRVGLVPIYGAGGFWQAQTIDTEREGSTRAHALVRLLDALDGAS